MDHLKMHSLNKIDENIAKIAQLFPNCVTEAKGENGEITKKIDFDMLKQELSSTLVEGREERYQFTWPDKKQAILTANAPINKTLRPCREESVNFDETENLYIEGDNLEVLKLLQETYLGKIKMIYIDPPYNTGNDFVYNDDFSQDADDYMSNSGQTDEEGNYLVACFDEDVTEDTITKIAKETPYYFVMKDSSMANDSVATNFEQIFTTFSPETIRKIL